MLIQLSQYLQAVEGATIENNTIPILKYIRMPSCKNQITQKSEKQ